MTERMTLVLSDALVDLRDSLVRETHHDPTLPSLNQSEIVRQLLRAGADAHVDDGAALVDGEVPSADDLLPEHRVILYRRERYKEGEGQLNSLRGSFESRVRKHFEDRFASGWTPEGLSTFAENMRREAALLWPQDDERRREAEAFVEAWADAAVELATRSEFDPADAEAILEHIEHGSRETPDEQRDAEALDGEAQASADDDVLDDLVDDARRLLERQARTDSSTPGDEHPPSQAREPVQVETMLAERADVSQRQARRAVDRAAGRDDAEVSADD